MIFLSSLLRKHIYDIEGHKVGVLKDVCVSLYDVSDCNCSYHNNIYFARQQRDHCAMVAGG